MHRHWFARASAAAAIGTVAALSMAAPGWAATQISINPGNVPTTAAGFPSHECDANFGGGPYAGQDVWVFNLPGNHKVTGDFVTVLARFDTDGNGTADTTVTIEAGAADGDDVVTTSGTSKAWAVTPAGWTLVGATATITGTADKFVLTHTCPAGVEESPTPSPSPSETAEPTESPGASGGTGGGTDGGGSLVSVAPMGGLVVVGAGLLAFGAALLAARRRRAAVELA